MNASQRTDLRASVLYGGTALASAPRFFGKYVALLVVLLVSALAAVSAQTAPSHATEIHDHLRKAAEFLKANDPNSAVKEFEAVVALDPKNAEAYTNLGVVAFFQHDYSKAAGYLHKALVIDPVSAKTQALLGICEKRLGDPAARSLLEKSFPKLKDKRLQLQVGMELESLYDQQGDPERAVAVMQKLVDLNPDDVDILYMAQRLYRELADDTLDKLAVIAPGGPNAAGDRRASGECR